MGSRKIYLYRMLVMSLLKVQHAIAQEIAPQYLVVLVKLQELSAPPCATVVEEKLRNVLYLMACIAQAQTNSTKSHESLTTIVQTYQY
jgi:hypothetical protein